MGAQHRHTVTITTQSSTNRSEPAPVNRSQNRSSSTSNRSPSRSPSTAIIPSRAPTEDNTFRFDPPACNQQISKGSSPSPPSYQDVTKGEFVELVPTQDNTDQTPENSSSCGAKP